MNIYLVELQNLRSFNKSFVMVHNFPKVVNEFLSRRLLKVGGLVSYRESSFTSELV